MTFEGWELAMIDEAGYNGITENHILRVVEELQSEGCTHVNQSAFRRACEKCGIDPDCFSDVDIDDVLELLSDS